MCVVCVWMKAWSTRLRQLGSVSHDVHTYEQSKVSLSPFDDKRYILDSVHSVPYGHIMIEDCNSAEA